MLACFRRIDPPMCRRGWMQLSIRRLMMVPRCVSRNSAVYSGFRRGPRDVPIGYGGLRLMEKVGGSDRTANHVYDPAGAAPTIRTDDDGPGLATGLYWFGGLCRRLSFRDAARTHSIPETTINEVEPFVTTTTSDESRQEKELFRLIGNSIPVTTLHNAVCHLLSLLNW